MSVIPFPEPIVGDDPEPEVAEVEFRVPGEGDGEYDDQPVESAEWVPDLPNVQAMGEGEYEVRQGECIGSIAAKFGLLPETLWELNEPLRKERPDEFVLLPKDRVTIPEPRIAKRKAETGKRHVFRRKRVPLHLRFDLTSEDGTPYKLLPFIIEGENFRHEGKTSNTGLFETWIPPQLEHARISFPEQGEIMEVEVGALDPVTTIRGVQARLRNLALYAGPVDGELNLPAIVALGRFRVWQSIEAQDGVIFDEPTLQKLLAVHGS